MKKSIIAIIVYYDIALALRYAAQLYYASLDGTTVSIYFMHLIRLFDGLGPFIGALFCLFVMRRTTTYSATGLSLAKSIASWGFPLALFGVYDIIYAPEISATLSMAVLLLYGILEETGWRGYLQSELEQMGIKPWLVPLIVAPMWWLWHLSFGSIGQMLIHLSAIIAGSYGIAYVISTTRSVMLAACFHILFNFFLREVYIERNAITISIIAVSVVFWIVIWYVRRPSVKNSESI